MADPQYVGPTGSKGNTGFSNTLIIPTSKVVPVGHHLIVVVGYGALATAVTFTCAGSAGNTWRLDRQYEVLSRKSLVVFSADITTAIPSGGTVTVTAASAVKMAGVLVEADQTLAVDALGTDTTTTSGTVDTPTAGLNARDFVLGCLSIPNIPPVTATADPNWTVGPSAASTSGTTDVEVATEYGVGGPNATTAGWSFPANATTSIVLGYTSTYVAPPGASYGDQHQLVAGKWIPLENYQLVAGVWT